MNANIITSASTAVRKAGFKFKKHSPEILAAVGVVGTVASAVLACKATTKVSEILDDTKEKVDQVHQVIESEEISEETYSEQDAQKDLAIIYVQSGVKLAKLYAPAIALGALSIGCILTSNNILRKRNIALAAAYATVDKGFKEYRNRVVERFGETVDRELKYNIKAKKITETEIDPESGKEKKVKKTVDVVSDPNEYSDYARFFDEACRNWEKDPEYNLVFLKAQQQFANDLLRSRGHLFLNEVYDMLDIPRTKAGQVVGWVYNTENPVGDNYVDFGIYDLHRETNRDFVNGYERAILLDFNVDGNIWDLI